jgi:hypothetical protein
MLLRECVGLVRPGAKRAKRKWWSWRRGRPARYDVILPLENASRVSWARRRFRADQSSLVASFPYLGNHHSVTMSLILSRLRPSILRPVAANRILSASSARFFWYSPDAAKPTPPPEQPASTKRSTSTTASIDDVESITATDIVKHVAEVHNLTQVESRRVINTIFDAIKEVRRIQALVRNTSMHLYLILT